VVCWADAASGGARPPPPPCALGGSSRVAERGHLPPRAPATRPPALAAACGARQPLKKQRLACCSTPARAPAAMVTHCSPTLWCVGKAALSRGVAEQHIRKGTIIHTEDLALMRRYNMQPRRQTSHLLHVVPSQREPFVLI
jgi:hypothetical protein